MYKDWGLDSREVGSKKWESCHEGRTPGGLMLLAPWKGRWRETTYALQYITTELVSVLVLLKTTLWKLIPRTCSHIGLGFKCILPTSPQNPQVEKKLKHQCKTVMGNLDSIGALEKANTWLTSWERHTLNPGHAKFPERKPCWEWASSLKLQMHKEKFHHVQESDYRGQ